MADAEPATADDLVGRTLDDRYAIEAVLGEGGLGRVYRGRHLKLGRTVAIKVLLEEFREESDVEQRFQREAQTLSKLSHPNIVTVTDFGSAEGVRYLVMELVEGDDLDTVIERDGALPVERAVGIMTQILRSLAYAHELGVIHRDLKLGNVHVRSMSDGSEHVEVLDFGLAKFMETAEVEGTGATNVKLTRAGTIMGTPAYMAPEQVDGVTCDARTDVYAAGVMLFELLTGRLPFLHNEPAGMLRAHLVQPPPKLRDVINEAPPALEAIILRAMAKTPEERFADGGDMLAVLEAADLDAGVTGKIRVLSGALSENVERLSGEVAKRARDISTELHLPERFAGVRAKLPPPLRRLPTSVLGAMAIGIVFCVLLAIGIGLAVSEPPKLVANEGITELPEGADLDAVETLDDLPDARDPFEDTSDLAAPLQRIKRVLDANRWRSRRTGRRFIGTLTSAAEANPDDCRPVLLHARGFTKQRFLSGALPLYEEAFRRDPSCRGDPHMLSDLVMMAGTRTLEREASAAVIRIYGSEAEQAVEEAIATTTGDLPRHEAERGRYQRLLEAL
ncbi:MAG: serine/threonine-protein kinase [Myxococcota bacterium]